MARIEIPRKSRVVLQATCKDETDTLFDPTTLQVVFQVPPYDEAHTTTYTYGVDAEVIKISTGVYRCVVYCDFTGNLRGLWRSTATNQESRTPFDVYISPIPLDT